MLHGSSTEATSGICTIACAQIGSLASSEPGGCCSGGVSNTASGICQMACAPIGSLASGEPYGCCTGGILGTNGYCQQACAQAGSLASSQFEGCCTGNAPDSTGTCEPVCAQDGQGIPSVLPLDAVSGNPQQWRLVWRGPFWGLGPSCPTSVAANIEVVSENTIVLGQSYTVTMTGGTTPPITPDTVQVTLNSPDSSGCSNGYGYCQITETPTTVGTYTYSGTASYSASGCSVNGSPATATVTVVPAAFVVTNFSLPLPSLWFLVGKQGFRLR